MRNDKWLFLLTFFGILAFATALPHPAFAAFGAAPWENALQTVVDYMTGSTARLIAILAVAGMGVGMLAGHVSIRAALGVIIGIAVIFGSATIVDLFSR